MIEKHFTATTYILYNKKVLLQFHKKFQKWLPPGGHVEKNETPAEAAKREAKEETGLDIAFISEENLKIHYPHANSIDRPYLCLLEDVPAYRDQAKHQHIDFIYLATPAILQQELRECCRWFTLTEARNLKPGIEIFQDSLDILTHLFSKNLLE